LTIRDQGPPPRISTEAGGALCAPSEILARAKRGDPDALDRVTRCYGERLLEVGRRRCAEQGEDAVQEALIEAHDHLAEVREPGTLEGWLVRLVQRACGRLRRGHKNDPRRHFPLESAALMEDSTSAPDLAAIRGEQAIALGEALLELPAEDRMILLLSEAEGQTGPEVAAALGLSHDVVRARLSRVRRRLRERLAPVIDGP